MLNVKQNRWQVLAGRHQLFIRSECRVAGRPKTAGREEVVPRSPFTKKFQHLREFGSCPQCGGDVGDLTAEGALKLRVNAQRPLTKIGDVDAILVDLGQHERATTIPGSLYAP